MKKLLLFIIIVIVIGGIIWYLVIQKVKVSTIDSDTTISKDYTIEEKEKVVVRNGSKLTIEGNLVVRGEITCENGPLSVVVEGDTTIENKLTCDRGEELPEGDIGAGISIVAKGPFTLAEEGEIVSNGHIQIVDNSDDLATTQEQVDQLYEEAASDTGDGPRIGPIVPEESGQPISFSFLQTRKVASTFPAISSDKAPSFSLFNIAYAQAAPPVVVRGNIRVNTPPKGVRQIIVFYFPNATGVNIQNFSLTGPDGRPGTDDKGNSCNAKGGDGENAFRFLAWAPNITVNNFTLRLGSGGKGGDAETKKDCDPGIAKGGKGGKAGNFKMRAANNFDIQGAFMIYPGKGGDGGNAIAHGKDGGPSEKGGDAIATGGDEADNKKQLRILGTITGTNNVQVGSVYGGNGGKATANPGKGGDGLKCGDGGDGGNGTATGGKGGDASLTLAGSAGRTADAEDVGGNGGNVKVKGGAGGNGGHCDPTAAGGNGGKGGDAEATEGKGGVGTTSNGQDGVIEDETGGDGGDGGDGCPEGKGGKGGKGNPPGQDGQDGKNICPHPEEEGTTTETTPETTPEPETTTEPEPEPEPEPETSTINISPQNLDFEHLIGDSPCPQLIDTVEISKTGTGPTNTWQILDHVPAWLEVETSGTVPETVNLSFNCTLEEYVTQMLSTTLNFQLVNQDGEAVGESVTLKVTGYITGE